MGESFGVVRLRRRLFTQSYVGAIYTVRDERGTGADERHTAGADFRFEFHRITHGLAVLVAVPWHTGHESSSPVDSPASGAPSHQRSVSTTFSSMARGSTWSASLFRRKTS